MSNYMLRNVACPFEDSLQCSRLISFAAGSGEENNAAALEASLRINYFYFKNQFSCISVYPLIYMYPQTKTEKKN